MPFTRNEFFDVFEQYNLAVWPAPVAAYIIGVAVLLWCASPSGADGRATYATLGSFWVWTGVMYHMLEFTRVNPMAWLFGGGFVLQGILFIVRGLSTAVPRFRVRAGIAEVSGGLFAVFALAGYPVLGFAFGHYFPRAPVFGITPCPLTLYTFGILLLASRPVPIAVLVLPALWSIIGTFAAVSLGVVQDFALPIVATSAALVILRKNRRIAATRATT